MITYASFLFSSKKPNIPFTYNYISLNILSLFYVNIYFSTHPSLSLSLSLSLNTTAISNERNVAKSFINNTAKRENYIATPQDPNRSHHHHQITIKRTKSSTTRNTMRTPDHTTIVNLCGLVHERERERERERDLGGE